jgi:prepilin-type N-terminal cleavage/methylation domain-containing protein
MKKDNNKKAFTLIELIVVLFLVTILVTLIIINYNSSTGPSNLVNHQSSIYNNLKLAQSHALSSRTYGDILPDYWGIYISASSSKIILFADINGDGLYSEGESNALLGGRELNLPNDVNIRLSFGVEELLFLFKTGDGRMTIYNVDDGIVENYPWHIELSGGFLDMGRLIMVEPPGKIDVDFCYCNEADMYCCSFCPSYDNCIEFESL